MVSAAGGIDIEEVAETDPKRSRACTSILHWDCSTFRFANSLLKPTCPQPP
jgi:succinyl-CoA synthetase beta subunit